jgi:predicted MFS family arabinose efflux permease
MIRERKPVMSENMRVRLEARFGVLGRREFRLLFGAAAISLVGDGVVPVALAFAVLDLTGSATDLGIVLGAGTLALVCSLLVGGVTADRVNRRAVMIVADLTRLVGQGAIGGLLIAGDAPIAAMAASQALLGAATGFFSPASSGLMPAVAGERLQEANALRAMASAAGNIGGPALGGILVVAIGPGPALVADAGTYAVSALLLAAMRDGTRVRAPARQRFLADLRTGFAELRSRTWACAIIVAASFVNTVGVAFPVLGAVVAKRQLGGAAPWAALLAARAVGLFVGGTILLRIQPRRPLLAAVPACGAAALPLLLLALPAPLILIVMAAAGAGLGTALFNILWETTLQQDVPSHARSRVSSYDWLGSLALQPIGYALIGPLAAVAGVSGALYVCATLVIAAILPLLFVRDIRTMTRRDCWEARDSADGARPQDDRGEALSPAGTGTPRPHRQASVTGKQCPL